MVRPPRLGRGLESLLSQTLEKAASTEEVLRVPIAEIVANRHQPRRGFDEEGIKSLAESIRHDGLLSPILVRRGPAGYELVAGERRLRACKTLGWREIPALVRGVDDVESLSAALVENLQREDLTAIEKGEAFRQLAEGFGWNQEEIARRTGLARSSVANFMRLLELPGPVRELVSRGTLGMGHARALLSMPDPNRCTALAHRAVAEDASVREVEEWVRVESARPLRPRKPERTQQTLDPYFRELEDRLRRTLGLQVRLIPIPKKGRLVIEYGDNAGLERLLRILGATEPT